MLRACRLLGLVAWPILAQPPATPGIEAYLGAWSGTMAHRGETSPIALELEPAGEGKVRLRVSLPGIQVSRVPMAQAVPAFEGGQLVLGPFRLSLQEAGQALGGVMPEALVPVHAVPFTLRRVAAIQAVPRSPLEAPRRDPRWTYEAGSALWAGPTWAAGVVYAGGDDGRLHAVDAATGRARWVQRLGGAIRCRPTVAGGRVFVASDDGWLQALSAATGEPLWRVRVAEKPAERLPFEHPKSRYDRWGSDAAVHGGQLYLGTHEGGVLALEAATGRVLWRFQAGDAVLAAPGVDGTRVYAGCFDGKVLALDRGTGRLLWSMDTRKPVVSTPAVAGDRVVIGSRSYDLFGLDAATGRVAWSRYLWLSWVESSALVQDGTAFVGSSDAAVVQALDAATGALRWRTDVHGWAWGQPAVDAERVFVGTSSQVGYASVHQAGVLALDRRTGKVLWHHLAVVPAKGAFGFPGAPALGGGGLFVGDLNGRLLAFDR